MLSNSRILFLLLVLFGPRILLAQAGLTPIALSDRVGSSISLEERAYFNLFHRFPNFRGATFLGDGEGVRMVDIMLDVNGSEVTQRDTLEPEVFNELARYVNHFEALYSNTRSVEWGRIIRYAGPQRWKRRKERADVTLLDGMTYEGKVVYIDDTQMVLTSAKQALPYLPESRIINIDPATVETVRIRYGPFKAMLNGLEELLFFSRIRYVFGDQDRYERQVASELQKHTVFPGIYPPEMDSARALPPVSLTRAPAPAEQQYLRRINYQWTLQVNTGVPLFRSQSLSRFSSIDEDLGNRNLLMTDRTFQMSVQKKLSKRLRVGGIVQYYPSNRVRSVAYFEPGTSLPLPLNQREQSHIQLSGPSFAPTVSFLIAVSDARTYALERRLALLSRFDVALTIGPSISSYTLDASIDPRDIAYLYTGYRVQVYSFSKQEFIVGGLGQLEVHFYPREYISIGLTGEYSALPIKQFDFASLESPLQENINYETRSLLVSSTLFTQMSLYLSLRVHF